MGGGRHEERMGLLIFRRRSLILYIERWGFCVEFNLYSHNEA